MRMRSSGYGRVRRRFEEGGMGVIWCIDGVVGRGTAIVRLCSGWGVSSFLGVWVGLWIDGEKLEGSWYGNATYPLSLFAGTNSSMVVVSILSSNNMRRQGLCHLCCLVQHAFHSRTRHDNNDFLSMIYTAMASPAPPNPLPLKGLLKLPNETTFRHRFSTEHL